MGKKKTAHRNPSITWDELAEIRQFREDTLVTHGERYTVVRSAGRGGRWVLRSEAGLTYTMDVRPNGVVEAPVLYL